MSQALSDEANELLPIFNKTSTKFYNSIVPLGDWSGEAVSGGFSKPKGGGRTRPAEDASAGR